MRTYLGPGFLRPDSVPSGPSCCRFITHHSTSALLELFPKVNSEMHGSSCSWSR